MKIRLFDAMIDQKFGVSVYDIPRDEKNEIQEEMGNWCTYTFGESTNHGYFPSKWKQSFGTFYFMTENQRNMFLLRWG